MSEIYKLHHPQTAVDKLIVIFVDSRVERLSSVEIGCWQGPGIFKSSRTPGSQDRKAFVSRCGPSI